ncbi:hypothetical protein [Natrinema gelatinilyticum]|uniref:hypothetical protein n=1 Tax=Natrinema gelatinilyticum TaxID=2961571 RepID=UPI0020C20931|nr:hypothetical protein [Natrinema gelatinilyticum]
MAYVLVAPGFAVGGLGYGIRSDWWEGSGFLRVHTEEDVNGAAVLSAVTIVVLWNGQFDLLVVEGTVGVLIDVAILVAVVVLR